MNPPGTMNIFDGHNDTLTHIHRPDRGQGRTFFIESEIGHIDLPRAMRGGLVGGIFAIFTPPPPDSPERDPQYGLTITTEGYTVLPRSEIDHAYAVVFTDAVLETLKKIEREAAGAVRWIRSYSEIEACLRDGKLALVLGFEGAEAIREDLSNLEDYYHQGLRVLGPVWSRPNRFAEGTRFQFPGTPNTGNGLSRAGKELIRECNRLGILIDMAHLNEPGFWDVARISDAPLVVSHADAHTLCPSARNLTDAQIDAVGRSGGLIGINFEPRNTRPDGRHEPDTPLTWIVKHIAYIADRIGIDHVALGSDFDGAGMPQDLSDAGKLPNLVTALEAGGFDPLSIAKVTSTNWLRLFKETWKDATVRNIGLSIMLGLFLLAVRPAVAQKADTLLVDLDARDASAGTEQWANRGTLGAFERVGQPKVVEIGSVKAVAFDGRQDAYRGPVAAPNIVGRQPRTIEVWAYNPALDSDEETLVSMGKRGGPGGTLLAFGWGRNPAYGAVAHWETDLGWNGVPKPKRWHYLVYTYDGKTARVYDNGLEKSARDLALNTAAGLPIVLAAETTGAGKIQFTNEFTGAQQAGSLMLAAVRIRAGALTVNQIVRTFDAEAARYGAERAIASNLILKGTRKLTVGELTLTLLNATQTAVSLFPTGTIFDFLPSDRLTARIDDNFYHLGDVTLRTQVEGAAWQSFSTATGRDTLAPLDAPSNTVATDLKPALGADCPLLVRREWTQQDGHLVLRFHLMNAGTKPVRIGAFGVPMVFNNLLTNRSLDEAHEKCSFADPYIGGEHGYLQVTRLNGKGTTLLVLPEHGTSFEAYRPLYDDPTPREVTFEGFYEWMVHTAAYAQNEWKQAQPWNTPTDKTLQPGESTTYGFQFVLSPSIAEIEATLIAQKRPVVIGIPGYVLPSDQTGRLFLHTEQPLQSLRSDPAGALDIQPDGAQTPHGWQGFTIHGLKTGRTRLLATYRDGSTQAIHYNITQPEATAVERLGAFHASKQWFDDPKDPFHRTDAFMQFDRDTGKIVLQHPHSWFVGLSDEIGAGPSVAMAMKNLGQPDASQVALLETYVNHTLWGRLQNPAYGVRASLFYYEPNQFPNYYTVREGWDRARTETTWRAYNYPHVAAVYWSLYRLARTHPGLVKQQTWQWYLRQAYGTAMALQTQSGPRRDHYGLAQFGLMVGSIFPEILEDLKREGWNWEADAMEGFMRERADHWRSLKYPFGSEMPWDSTGQEEVYTWSRYFGYEDRAQVTLNAVLAYMPTVPNWAYNGAARRYFDAPVNGTRWPDIVRMTNHYGSSLNAIPVLDAYRQYPDDLRLLRVGYAGMSQVTANIDSNGFASYGFDADPRILQFDPYTADYGIAFYGYAHNTGAYVVHDPEFGWLGFGCNLQIEQDNITVFPRDGFHNRVFLAPLHLWLTLDSGSFESVRFNSKTQQVEIQLSPKTPATSVAGLRIETTGNLPTLFAPADAPAKVRGAYPIPLAQSTTNVLLRTMP